MVLPYKSMVGGHVVQWGKVEKQGGYYHGQWMAIITGARCVIAGNRSGKKNVFAPTQETVLEKAITFITSGTIASNIGSASTGGLVRKSNDKAPHSRHAAVLSTENGISSSTDNGKVLTNVVQYYGHRFAYGKVKKVGGPFENQWMIRITGGPACPPGSGKKDFFGVNEHEAIKKAQTFVDSWRQTQTSSPTTSLSQEATSIRSFTGPCSLGGSSSSSISSTGSRQLSSTGSCCTICLLDPANEVAIVPCGHCFCRTCASTLAPEFLRPPEGLCCPTCRGKVTMLMKIYPS
ncbi:unnamed protein product [Amoebophrya sp. A25]|nr:unnamed protein product [Amoebophrya sp. A25]|eukprot:GSA25T00015953001.1